MKVTLACGVALQTPLSGESWMYSRRGGGTTGVYGKRFSAAAI